MDRFLPHWRLYREKLNRAPKSQTGGEASPTLRGGRFENIFLRVPWCKGAWDNVSEVTWSCTIYGFES